MEIIVPDASIILKWALGEEKETERDKALSILYDYIEGRCEIVLPSLWVYEVGNILGMKHPESSKEIMDILLDYEFKEYRMSKDVCRLIFELIRDLRVTFYDASYHALAIKQKGIFITSDKKYYDKVRDKSHIQLLELYRF